MNKAVNIDPRELAKGLLEKVRSEAHPYILYSENEVESLKDKVTRGVSKKAYERMLITSEEYMSRSGILTPTLHPGIGRFFQSRFTYLILTGIISGEEKYIDKALELAVTSAESGNMELFVGFNNALSVGDFAHAYALAYDALYHRMTEEQRQLLRRTMEALGEWIYTNSPKINTWGSAEPRRQAWNWNVITHGALGLVALTLGDHEDWLALSIERLLGYCRYAVDSTGAAMEGLHYVGFALNTLTPLANAIHRLTGVEIMDVYTDMHKLPYWSMNMTAPFGKEQAAIGQGSEIGNYSATFYIINRYRQEDALWGWLNTYGLLDHGFEKEFEGNGWSMPALILFEDQSLTPKKPTADKNPLIKSFAKGIVTARDTWNHSGSMATFTCGYGYAGCWNHPDDNSFTFYAKGESFVIDLGAGKKSSDEHNVVLVDGVGMDYAGGATMVIGNMEQNSVLEGGELYLRGDNKDSYRNLAQLDRSVRHLIYRGGDVPFVIAYDDAGKEGEHTYSVNFYTKHTNTVNVADDNKSAVIIGGNGGAVCHAFAYSPDGVRFEKTAAYNGIATSSVSKKHRQITLFIACEEDKLPKIDFASDNATVTVKLTFAGEDKALTFVFGENELISPAAVKTEDRAPIPSPVLQSIGQEAATEQK